VALVSSRMIADASPVLAMSASSTRHILIVEDDGDLLEVLKFVLEDEGYHVSTAEGGADALSAASSQDFNLVLLDVSMPDMSGIEVAKRLRADPRTANVRLALHTGSSVAEIREQFTDFDAFIGKTENAEDLVAAINAAIEQLASTPSRADDASQTAAV
jgi:CheY-like chemotaxis protein